MADKRAQRAQKKREKDRKKRQAARSKRGTRKTSTSLAAAAGWPLGECWISDNWDQRGANVLVGFSRMPSGGLGAAAFFELDLAEDGVTKVDAYRRVNSDQVMGEAANRAGERTVLALDPALGVKLVHAARELQDSEPSKLGDAMVLFGDIGPEDSDEEILTGLDDTEEVETETGLFYGVRRFFGLV